MPLGSAVACLVALVLPASTPTRPPAAQALETGDLAFQTSRSAQSKGIQAARRARLELGRRERLGELHVRGLERALEARFGRVPRGLVLVTPASLAADPRLAPVPVAR